MAIDQAKQAGGGVKNKSAFVKSLPESLPAAEVVKKAKELGMELTEKYVWNIRSEARRKEGKAATRTADRAPVVRSGARRGRRPGRPAAAVEVGGSPLPTSGSLTAEDVLRAAAAEIGLGRALALLEAEREKVRVVLGS